MSILIIRTDTNEKVGQDHAMRCLALGKAWLETCGNVVVATAQMEESICEQFVAVGIKVNPMASRDFGKDDSTELAELAEQHQAGWVAIDGYQFGPAYLSTLKKGNFRVLRIDDKNHQASSDLVDIFLNQDQEIVRFDSRPDSQILAGPKYTLRNCCSSGYPGETRLISNRVRRVLIAFGGSDSGHLTLKAIEGLSNTTAADLQIRIASDSSDPMIDEIQSVIRRTPCMTQLVSKEQLRDEMLWADVAMTSASSLCWEMARVGLPMVTVSIDKNHAEVISPLLNEEVIVHLGDGDQIDSSDFLDVFYQLRHSFPKRCLMSAQSKRLVHDFGANRVVEAMVSHSQ